MARLYDNNWRVMGMWRDGRRFLVLMQTSLKRLRKALAESLNDYTPDDFNHVESIWIERYRPATAFQPGRWEPLREIRLRKYKLQARYRERRARRAAPAAERRCGSDLLWEVG